MSYLHFQHSIPADLTTYLAGIVAVGTVTGLFVKGLMVPQGTVPSAVGVL